jgi:DNA-binding XRE family transcriptional regulator
MQHNLHTIVTTPSGDEMIMLPRADYLAMRDAFDAALHRRTIQDIGDGSQEWLTQAEILQSLQAATPLAFWRNKRMISQTQLAATVGVSQSYIANLEAGKRKGDPALFMKLARALSVRIEDLIEHD